MNKFIPIFAAMILFNTAYAASEATLSLHIANNIKVNKYFFCIYGVGCLSIKAGNTGKTFDMPPMDVGNITKFVITDATNMQAFMQPSNQSCAVNVTSDQKLTITGRLVIQHNKPIIKDLHCRIA